MFIVEYMVLNNKNELVNPCGSDHTIIMRDLKTLRGVENRLKNFSTPKGSKRIDIYNVVNIFDRNGYKLVKQINL